MFVFETFSKFLISRKFPYTVYTKWLLLLKSKDKNMTQNISIFAIDSNGDQESFGQIMIIS